MTMPAERIPRGGDERGVIQELLVGQSGREAVEPERSVAELIEDAAGGDRDAQDVLFRRYYPLVRRIVALRMGRRLRALYEVDDLVQEVFLSVIRALPGIDARTESSFRNWLARLTQNRLTDVLRREGAAKRRSGALVSGDEGQSPPIERLPDKSQATPSGVFRGRELLDRLETALLDLPAHQRNVIVMRHLCGMSYEEIAEELQFENVVNARVALSRALRKLERALGL